MKCMEQKKYYTVITGASRGLGSAFAKVCARRGMNLVLVSLAGEGIHEYAAELAQEYEVHAVGYECDLTREEDLMALAAWINRDYPVSVLINNAGIGGTFSFSDLSFDEINRMLLLNVWTPVLLTRSLLPNLKNASQAYVLNIASIASFSPMPYKSVYPATKAFLYSFSMGLSKELQEQHIHVSVAHPGTMLTTDRIRSRVSRHTRLYNLAVYHPEEVAEACIRQMFRGKKLIIPGHMNRLCWLILRITPAWFRLRFLGRVFSKELLQKKKISYA